MYFDACPLDLCVEGAADEEGFIDDPYLIAIRVETALDSCMIEIYSVLRDFITFIDITRL